MQRKSQQFNFDEFVKNRMYPLTVIPAKARHSGESRNPVNSMRSGCRIKSGMTISGLFTSLSILNGVRE